MKKYIPIHKKLIRLSEINNRIIPEALKNISEILSKNNIEFCILGGVNLPVYNYNRTTDDIDLLINKKDKDKFYNLKGKYFKSAFKGTLRNFFWNIPKIKLEIIFSGEKAGSNKGIEYIEPNKIKIVKSKIPYLKLKYLIMYKLCSGLYGKARISDFGDVQKLILNNKLSKDFTNDFRKDLKDKYTEIWESTF